MPILLHNNIQADVPAFIHRVIVCSCGSLVCAIVLRYIEQARPVYIVLEALQTILITFVLRAFMR